MTVEPGLAPVGVPACLSRVMVDVRVMARVAELVADTVTLVGDVPDAVAVSEAMALVRDLSTDESPNFVNGLLGAVVRDKGQLVED